MGFGAERVFLALLIWGGAILVLSLALTLPFFTILALSQKKERALDPGRR